MEDLNGLVSCGFIVLGGASGGEPVVSEKTNIVVSGENWIDAEPVRAGSENEYS